MWNQIPATEEDMNGSVPDPESNTSEFNSANIENRQIEGTAEDQIQGTSGISGDQPKIPSLP